MEFFILVLLLVLWVIRKKLASSEKETKKQKRRFPAPTPWRDPWGERADTFPFPEEDEFGEEPVRPSFPSVTEPVEREIQSRPEIIGEAADEGEEVQETISPAEKLAEAGLKTVQFHLPPLKRKKRRCLEKGLFTKDSMIRGIMMRELLEPAPSRRYFLRMQRRVR